MANDRPVYVVTGSSAGVGAATVLSLSRRGAAVVINYSKSSAEAAAIAEQCLAASGDALVVQGDVSQDSDCRRIAAAALERWGRIDGLVNNAGTTTFAPMRKLDALEAEDFQRIYAVNTIGAFQMIRACEVPLRAARGAVVNVSSISSTMGLGSSLAYACSKGALNAMTIALARALGPEIRVNAVLPGFTETRWLKQGLGDAYEPAREAYRKQSALQATLAPDDVAQAIVSLLDNRRITGQLLTVDSGRALGG